jgi:hypothetical protein
MAGSVCQLPDVPRFFRGRPPALTWTACRTRDASTLGSPGVRRDTVTGSVTAPTQPGSTAPRLVHQGELSCCDQPSRVPPCTAYMNTAPRFFAFGLIA